MDAVNNQPMWVVYLLQCRNGALYCGISNRPQARWVAHLSGKGARYTRMHPPLAMRLVAEGLTESAARQQEHRIKQLPVATKQALWLAAAAFLPNSDTPL